MKNCAKLNDHFCVRFFNETPHSKNWRPVLVMGVAPGDPVLWKSLSERSVVPSLLLPLIGHVLSVLQESLTVWLHGHLLPIWLNGQVSFPQCNSDCTITQLHCAPLFRLRRGSSFLWFPPHPTCPLRLPPLVQHLGHLYLPTWPNPNRQAKSDSSPLQSRHGSS